MRWQASTLVLVCLLGLPFAAGGVAAEVGGLEGLVRDKESSEGLIAVDIVVAGSGVLVQTDLTGRFQVAELPVGVYSVRFSYLGYETLVVENVEIIAGRVRRLDVVLESFRANAIDDLMVTATRILSTEGAVLADRKRAVVVGDAISAAQISRSPDGQAGDALKRVTGLLVDGGGYVNVRGMPDRYNVTEIDGAIATAVDPDLDRKSFNFEMVPSNLLSNLQVVKTAMPDMPGDFTGGLVRINTVEFPENPTTQFSIQTGADGGSYGDSFYRDAHRGSTDWFGRDDGGRDRPRAVRDAGSLPSDNIPYLDEVARELPNRYALAAETTPRPGSVAVSHGNLLRPFGRRLGVVGAASYKSSASITNEYKTKDPLISNDRFEATDYLSEVNVGALLNLNLEIVDRQRVSFQNLYARSTENSFLSAIKRDNALAYRYVLEWEEKDQLTSSLKGSHAILIDGVDLSWRIFYNENNAKEPDLRFLEYNLETEPFALYTNRRHWLYAAEIRRGADAGLSWRFGGIDRPGKIAAGVSLVTRKRTLEHFPYHVAREGLSGGLVFLPPEDIFAPENFKQGLFTLRYQDQFESSYSGTQVMNAYYALIDLPFTLWREHFRLAGGARLENNRIAVDAYDKVTDVYIGARSRSDYVLPSVNVVYEYDERTNVRLACFRSLNYPELRELAPVKSSDFKNDWQLEGNPDLAVARIDNYDLRLERFPASGEVVAVSFFYKELRDAIESRLDAQSNYLDLYRWFNGDGRNYGVEIEFRKRLGFLSRSLDDITLLGNYVRIWSEVDFPLLDSIGGDDQSARFRTATRQLQGQAPWVVNLSLNWENPDLRTSLTILYNRVGRRLLTVAENPTFNRYGEPRHLLDAALTLRLAPSTSLKFAAKNILRQDEIRLFSVDIGQGGAAPEHLPAGRRIGATTLAGALSVKF